MEAADVTAPCEFCDVQVGLTVYEAHRKTCKKNPYELTYSETIPCEVCNKEIAFEEYNQHHESHIQPAMGEAAEDLQPRPGISINLSLQRSDQPSALSFGPEEEDETDAASFNLQQSTMVPRLRSCSEPRLDDSQLVSDLSSQSFTLADRQRRSLHSNSDLSLGEHSEQSFEMPSMDIRPNSIEDRMPQDDFLFGPNRLMALSSQLLRTDRQMSEMDSRVEEIQFMLEGLRSNMGLRNDTGLREKQLDEYFITTKYDKPKMSKLDEEYKRCHICLSDFEDGEDLRILGCCHRYHLQCIDNWLKSKTTCPVCKHDFKNFNTQ